jgi:hypothetical protein
MNGMMETFPYPDGRPSARLRIDAANQGIIFRHGNGPDGCDEFGAREASVVLEDGVFHLFYDGAKPGYGWRACLAVSRNLEHWEHHGPMLELGAPGEPDSGTATSPWFLKSHDLWHMFYLGSTRTTPDQDRIPIPPYTTHYATAPALAGPWTKHPDRQPFLPKEGTWHADSACPGYVLRHGDRCLMFFSAAAYDVPGDETSPLRRTLGLATAPAPEGPWQVASTPLLPTEEQIENSSVYFERANNLWFLFTNHIGLDHRGEYTDAVWVYWSKDPEAWDPANKAVVLDKHNTGLDCVGMPSVVPVGGRLAIFYDAPEPGSTTHMHRDIGLAWLQLPLRPPR